MLSHGIFRINSYLPSNTLRAMQVQDCEKLAVLARKTFEESYPDLLTNEELDNKFGKEFQDLVQAELKDPKIKYFVCEVDKNLIGFMKIIFEKDSACLDKLYFLKAWQGKGYGTFFLTEAFKLSLEKNYSKMQLYVWNKNDNAIEFYKKHGFDFTGKKHTWQTPDGTEIRSTALQMECNNLNYESKKTARPMMRQA